MPARALRVAGPRLADTRALAPTDGRAHTRANTAPTHTNCGDMPHHYVPLINCDLSTLKRSIGGTYVGIIQCPIAYSDAGELAFYARSVLRVSRTNAQKFRKFLAVSVVPRRAAIHADSIRERA